MRAASRSATGTIAAACRQPPSSSIRFFHRKNQKARIVAAIPGVPAPPQPSTATAKQQHDTPRLRHERRSGEPASLRPPAVASGLDDVEAGSYRPADSGDRPIGSLVLTLLLLDLPGDLHPSREAVMYPANSTSNRSDLASAFRTFALIAVLLGATILGSPVRVARANEPRPELEPGARVRVMGAVPSKNWIVGRVSAVSADTLYFIPEEAQATTVSVALAEPAQIELSAARHNGLRRGVVLGGLIGGAFGSLIVADHQLGYDVKEEVIAAYTGVVPPHQKATLTPLFVGIVSGCALGGALGASTSVERWVPVGLPAKFPAHLALGGSVDATGRVRVAVTVSP